MLINYENIYLNLFYSALYLILGFFGGLACYSEKRNKDTELKEKVFSHLFSSAFIGLIGGYIGQATVDNIYFSMAMACIFGIIRFSALNIIVAIIIKKMGIDVDKVKDTRKFINYTTNDKNETYEHILSNLISDEYFTYNELIKYSQKKYKEKMLELLKIGAITGVQYDILKESMYSILKNYRNKK